MDPRMIELAWEALRLKCAKLQEALCMVLSGTKFFWHLQVLVRTRASNASGRRASDASLRHQRVRRL